MFDQMGRGHSSELKDLEKHKDLRYGQGFSRAAAENVNQWEEVENVVYFCGPAFFPLPVVAPEWVKRSEKYVYVERTWTWVQYKCAVVCEVDVWQDGGSAQGYDGNVTCPLAL